MMEYRHWLSMAAKELNLSKNSKYDAETLLMHVTGKNKAFIIAFGETKIKPKELHLLNMLLARRKLGEPIAYIIGMHEFWSLPLYITPVTLIPRPDTECLVEQVLKIIPNKACRILDLGTGTGAIALAIASERPDCRIIAIDLFHDVVMLAKRNITHLGMSNVRVYQSYWFNALNMNNKTFDVIVSNPPYISKRDYLYIEKDVQFEPSIALLSPDNGLANLAHIIIHAKYYLHTNGWLAVEHGWRQGNAVRSLFNRENYRFVVTHRDYNGNERITLGCIN